MLLNVRVSVEAIELPTLTVFSSCLEFCSISFELQRWQQLKTMKHEKKRNTNLNEPPI